MTERDYYDLSGRVALITGASSHGIGNQSAKTLAAHGAKVFLVARREEKLQEAVAEIEANGGEASYFAGDASSEEVCKAAVEKCVADFGRLDIMVLAAGTSGLSERSMEDAFNTENWRNILAVNLDSVFFMVKYGWEECAKNGVGYSILLDDDEATVKRVLFSGKTVILQPFNNAYTPIVLTTGPCRILGRVIRTMREW